MSPGSCPAAGLGPLFGRGARSFPRSPKHDVVFRDAREHGSARRTADPGRRQRRIKTTKCRFGPRPETTKCRFGEIPGKYAIFHQHRPLGVRLMEIRSTDPGPICRNCGHQNANVLQWPSAESGFQGRGVCRECGEEIIFAPRIDENSVDLTALCCPACGCNRVDVTGWPSGAEWGLGNGQGLCDHCGLVFGWRIEENGESKVEPQRPRAHRGHRGTARRP